AFLLALAPLLTGLPLASQETDPVSVAARMLPAEVRPGEQVVLEVTLAIPSGWHVYGSQESVGTPVSLTVAESGVLRSDGPPEIPAGAFHESFGVESFWIEDEAVLRQTFTVPSDAAPGAIRVAGRVDYM